jgi:ABC-2 type transport system permease protein
MFQTIKPYWAYAKASFTVGFAYRLHILFWVLSDLVQVGVLLLIWIAIYGNSSSTTMQGYTLAQMMMYNLIIYMTASFTYMKPLFDLADDHFDGKVAMSLIKPTKYIYEVFFRNLGNNFVGNIIISLPLMIVLSTLTVTANHGVNFTLGTTILYVFSILLALLISFFSNFIFATMVFVTDATFGMMQLNEAVVRIFSGSLIPLSFFPGWLKTIAYILPYASVYTVPTLILMNRYTNSELWINLGIQLAWAIGLIIGANLIWSVIITKMKVHGG